MSRWYFALSVSLCFISVDSRCYELATHARLTGQAYSESVLVADVSLLRTLGLSITDPLVSLGGSYFEVFNTSVVERSKLDFVTSGELEIWPGSPARNSLSMRGWLIRGSVREDDYQNQSFLLGLCQVKGAPPIPAQENPLSRPVNHFYDPVNDRGLAAGQPATDWALGTVDALQVPSLPDAGRANHYTIVDAREALYCAPSLWISGPVPEKGFAQNNTGVVMPPWCDGRCPWKGSGSGMCSAGSIEGDVL